MNFVSFAQHQNAIIPSKKHVMLNSFLHLAIGACYSKNKHKKFTLEAIRLSCLRATRAITAQDARRVERPLF